MKADPRASWFARPRAEPGQRGFIVNNARTITASTRHGSGVADASHLHRSV
jgi:hypothetical protein